MKGIPWGNRRNVYLTEKSFLIKKETKMKTDTYTKSVLTIIAISLFLLVMKEFEIIPKAYAGSNANLIKSGYGLVPLNIDGSVNVKVNPDQVIDVRIRGIDEAPSLNWEAIKVKIEN